MVLGGADRPGFEYRHTRYVGLAMSIGVLLLAIGAHLVGRDHGIGAIVSLRAPLSVRFDFDLVVAAGG
jgi:hypothetical protein